MYEDLVKDLRELSHEFYLDDSDDYTEKKLSEAADAIEERSKPRWIPVTERLPEMNTSCLLYNEYYGPMVGARIDEMRFRIPGSRFPDTPTHWMPLPEPPKEG